MSIWSGLARVVSLYERAPIRQLLDIDPIGALDWIVVALGRRIVRLIALPDAKAILDAPASSSGWRGNLVFGIFWSIVAASAIGAFA